MSAQVWTVVRVFILVLTTHGAVLNPERVPPTDIEPLHVEPANNGHAFDFTQLVAAFESGTQTNDALMLGTHPQRPFTYAGEIRRVRNGPQRRNLLQATVANPVRQLVLLCSRASCCVLPVIWPSVPGLRGDQARRQGIGERRSCMLPARSLRIATRAVRAECTAARAPALQHWRSGVRELPRGTCSIGVQASRASDLCFCASRSDSAGNGPPIRPPRRTCLTVMKRVWPHCPRGTWLRPMHMEGHAHALLLPL